MLCCWLIALALLQNTVDMRFDAPMEYSVTTSVGGVFSVETHTQRTYLQSKHKRSREYEVKLYDDDDEFDDQQSDTGTFSDTCSPNMPEERRGHTFPTSSSPSSTPTQSCCGTAMNTPSVFAVSCVPRGVYLRYR